MKKSFRFTIVSISIFGLIMVLSTDVFGQGVKFTLEDLTAKILVLEAQVDDLHAKVLDLEVHGSNNEFTEGARLSVYPSENVSVSWRLETGFFTVSTTKISATIHINSFQDYANDLYREDAYFEKYRVDFIVEGLVDLQPPYIINGFPVWATITLASKYSSFTLEAPINEDGSFHLSQSFSVNDVSDLTVVMVSAGPYQPMP